jgi:glycosyltransferase involved in cell wall biosynthesis
MNSKKTNIVIQAGWSLDKIENNYYIPQTHFVYLNYISLQFDDIVLMSSVQYKTINDESKILLEFKNIRIVELPYYKSFIDSIKYFTSFYKGIRQLKDYKIFYCRVPDPFSWLPGLFFKKSCTIHFVGDAFESIWSNQFTSLINKIIYTIAYLPDFILTALVCYKSRVFTNGKHISSRLNKIGIKATPVISSTLIESDFKLKKREKSNSINLLFIGYLSKHKGIKTIIELIELLESKHQNYRFNIIGDGVMRYSLEEFIKDKDIQRNVVIHGHINNRSTINSIIDESDYFIFPSKSEGSPRVILEVMARNLPVISTPVGSLPYCFKDNQEILYCNFDNADLFYKKIEWAQSNEIEIRRISENAFNKVKNNYTQAKFLSQIFNLYEA